MFKQLFRIPVLAIFAVAAFSVSCEKEPSGGKDVVKQTVRGTVTDQDTGEPVAGAKVTVKDYSAQTDAQGYYELEIDAITSTVKITASAEKYADRSSNITGNDFVEGIAEKDFTLQFKGGVISGRVLNSAGTVGVENVEVTLGTIASTKTDGQGNFAFQGLVRDNYVVTFKSGDQVIERKVSVEDFADGDVVLAPVFMGSEQVLPYGVTRNDLCEAPKLLNNIYTGGTGPWGNGSDFTYQLENSLYHPSMRWMTAVWARKTMIGPSVAEDEFYAAQDKLDTYEESALRSDIINSAEGLALRTRFLRYDPENYASYIYGRKTICQENKILSVRAQFFAYGACADAPTNLYAGIVDLSSDKFELKETKWTLQEGKYIYSTDLSAYVGKEVVVILGVKQEVESSNHKSDWFGVHISTVTFAAQEMQEECILPGTEVLADYGITKEEAASMGVLAKGTYSGAYNEDFRVSYVTELVYPFDFIPYAGTSHIIANFGFRYLNAIPEVTTDFSMRVNTAEGVSTETPSSVLFAKVAAGGSVTVNGMVSNGTLGLGFLVVTEDGTATAINLADSNSAVVASCDLSGFTGNVLVCFCVYPRTDADASLTIENIQVR